MSEIVYLRNRQELTAEFVSLRNKHIKVLMVKKATEEEALEWLLKEPVEVVCLMEGEKMAGAAVLDLSNGGELFFFVLKKGKGAGAALVYELEKMAFVKGISGIWAWVGEKNKAARKTLEKCGFKVTDKSASRLRNDKTHKGMILEKSFIEEEECDSCAPEL